MRRLAFPIQARAECPTVFGPASVESFPMTNHTNFLLSSSSINGDGVVNAAGDDLGHIEDLMYPNPTSLHSSFHMASCTWILSEETSNGKNGRNSSQFIIWRNL